MCHFEFCSQYDDRLRGRGIVDGWGSYLEDITDSFQVLAKFETKIGDVKTHLLLGLCSAERSRYTGSAAPAHTAHRSDSMPYSTPGQPSHIRSRR